MGNNIWSGPTVTTTLGSKGCRGNVFLQFTVQGDSIIFILSEPGNSNFYNQLRNTCTT